MIIRTAVGVACVAVAFAAAAASAGATVFQTFDITVVGPLSGNVTASGAAVTGRGTATPTSATAYSLSFPTGPGSLTQTVLQSAGFIGSGCIERLTQGGTFTFRYSPTATVGLVLGGDGAYTQSSFTVYRPLLGGGCDTADPPLTRDVTVHAAATHVVAVL